MNRSIRIALFMVLVAAFICGIAVCSAEENSFKTPGSIVTFGRYPQTAEGTDETPIEWIVLEYDEINHRALLLSKYGLDGKPYNTDYTEVTWETCSLRSWLNDEFMNKAFNPEEQAVILLTEVDNSDEQGYSEWSISGGNNTQDNIFLLSFAEANRYFNVEYYKVSGSGENISSRVAPTAYAKKQGVYASKNHRTAEDKADTWWWQRSPGRDQRSAAIVDNGGALNYIDADNPYGCVRPALWISVE